MPTKKPVRTPYKVDIPKMPDDFKGFPDESDPARRAELTAGPDQNFLQKYLSSDPNPRVGSSGAQMGRGVFNALIPGVTLDQNFKFDLSNPVTGKGRRDYIPGQGDLNQTSNLTGAAAKLGLDVLSGAGPARGALGLGGGLLRSFTEARELEDAAAKAAAAARVAEEGTKTAGQVSKLFNLKALEQIPESFKTDPVFLREAQAQFDKLNKGQIMTHGLEIVPTLAKTAPKAEEAVQATSKAQRMINAVGDKGGSMLRKAGTSIAENPLRAQGIAGGVTGLLNEAADSVDADGNKTPTPTGEDVVPVMGDLQDIQDIPNVTPERKQSAVERYRAMMAGNKGLEDYKPGWFERVGSYIFPASEGRSSDIRRRSFMEDQILKQAYKDPEHAFAYQELLNDMQSERGVADQEAKANAPSARRKVAEDFAMNNGAAMTVEGLAKILGVSPKDIDESRLAQQTRNPPSQMEQLMARLYAEQTAAQGGANTVGGGGKKLNAAAQH